MRLTFGDKEFTELVNKVKKKYPKMTHQQVYDVLRTHYEMMKDIITDGQEYNLPGIGRISTTISKRLHKNKLLTLYRLKISKYNGLRKTFLDKEKKALEEIKQGKYFNN